MRKTTQSLGEKTVKDITRPIREQYCSEEKFRIVLDGLSGGDGLPLYWHHQRAHVL